MVAALLLVIMLTGVLSLGAFAFAITENQGHLAARTTEYAQDKMEQLLSLAFGDAQTDTTQFPAVNNGGTGLAIGGSSNTAAPVVGYADYLDASGNLLCPCAGGAPANWYYKRVWQVATISATLKQVTVSVITSSSFAQAVLPTSTVTALKTSPF
jgi:hypothetical protein